MYAARVCELRLDGKQVLSKRSREKWSDKEIASSISVKYEQTCIPILNLESHQFQPRNKMWWLNKSQNG